MDGFVFTGFPDASTVGFPDVSTVGFPDASVEEEENMLLILPNTPPDDVGFPDASVVGFPDASVEEEENMLLILPNTPPDDVGFPDASVEEEENMLPNIPPDASVTGFPDASVEEENGDERLNASLFDENNALIGAAPFKNDFIILFISMNYYKNYYY
jgi:hypothetical protein